MYSKPVYVVEEIGKVVADAVKLYYSPIYYLFGHPVEIVKRLQDKANSPGAEREQMFPLIALFTDIEEVVGDKPGLYADVRLNIIIANYTEATYISEQRLEKNFKKILYPIKIAFFKALERSKAFTWEGELQFSSTDHYFWGKKGLYENTENVFNDYIDAIELSNLKLTIKNKIC